MSDLNIDGLEEQQDWKSKYEALLKENTESKESRKLLQEQLEAKAKSVVNLEEESRTLKRQLEESWNLEEKSSKRQKTGMVDQLLEKLEERVRCPVCLEVPTSGPMYSCTNGHLVCATCYRGSFSDCSLCKTKMNKTVSLLASTVIENIEHKCKYETDGCKKKTPLAGIEEHKKICSFRPVDCPSHRCEEEVPFELVVDHLLKKCKYSFGKTDVTNSSITGRLDFPAGQIATAPYSVKTYKWNNKFFFLNIKMENKHHRKFYVQMLGTEEECKKYTVEISLKAKTGKCAAMFCDNPFPIEVAEEDLKAGGMLVTKALLKKISFPMVDQPDWLSFSVLLTFAPVALED